eukprot:g5962.t1
MAFERRVKSFSLNHAPSYLSLGRSQSAYELSEEKNQSARYLSPVKFASSPNWQNPCSPNCEKPSSGDLLTDIVQKMSKFRRLAVKETARCTELERKCATLRNALKEEKKRFKAFVTQSNFEQHKLKTKLLGFDLSKLSKHNIIQTNIRTKEDNKENDENASNQGLRINENVALQIKENQTSKFSQSLRRLWAPRMSREIEILETQLVEARRRNEKMLCKRCLRETTKIVKVRRSQSVSLSARRDRRKIPQLKRSVSTRQ